MNNLISTSEIVKNCNYFDSPEEFYKNFPDDWSNFQSKVIKLETKQVYDETGNQSYDLLLSKDLDASIDLIPLVRECDIELYNDLRLKNIEFIRCRPVILPLSLYLQWEFECYIFNSYYGEKIYCLDYKMNESVFNLKAQHDFMVFDDTIAFIHNYDNSGRIQGGWIVESENHISSLVTLFDFINNKAIKFSDYLDFINHKCKLVITS